MFSQTKKWLFGLLTVAASLYTLIPYKVQDLVEQLVKITGMAPSQPVAHPPVSNPGGFPFDQFHIDLKAQTLSVGQPSKADAARREASTTTGGL